MAKEVEYRSYKRSESVLFWKTKEKYGELSNMAGGFPLLINDVRIPSSEALYQACKFPHLPELQKKIIDQSSPLLAKKICKSYERQERGDWYLIRTKVMRWCLRVKAVQNWLKFTPVLLNTGDLSIVEYSEKDDFWGALPWDSELLNGRNVLGRLLMELREEVKKNTQKSDWEIGLPKINDFKIFGREIDPPKDSNGIDNDFSDIW